MNKGIKILIAIIVLAVVGSAAYIAIQGGNNLKGKLEVAENRATQDASAPATAPSISDDTQDIPADLF